MDTKRAVTEHDKLIRRIRRLQTFAHETYLDYLGLYKFCEKLVDTYEDGDYKEVDGMLQELSDILDEDYPIPY